MADPLISFIVTIDDVTNLSSNRTSDSFIITTHNDLGEKLEQVDQGVTVSPTIPDEVEIQTITMFDSDTDQQT